MPDSVQAVDFFILGSGSTAFAAALRAQELGATRIVMAEERTVGGTCVGRGCIPSKNLIAAAEAYHAAHHPRFAGLGATSPTLDFPALIAQKDEVIHTLREKKYLSISEASASIAVVRGHASFVDAHTVAVSGKGGEQRYWAENILIATGSRPHIPDLPGLGDVPYLTSDLLTSEEDRELKSLPKSLIILGSGYVALELGQMFARFGSEVTILERSPRVLHGYEPIIGATIVKLLREEGLTILTRAEVKQIRQDGAGVVVRVSLRGEEQELRAERLLVATGRAANTQGLGLEQAGVVTDERGFVVVDEHLATSTPGIWAAGDVIGTAQGSQLATPVGARDGVIAADNAIGRQLRAVNHQVIPRAIFTDPQIAVVGLTEDEAIAQGIPCSCHAVELALVPRAQAIRDTRGVIKMVADADTDRVVGVHLVAPGASELIHEAAMAMHFGAKVHDFVDLIHVYPSMSEVLKLAALSFTKDVSKLSCCAE